MARDTKEYVLVHGAAHGAWCWEDVAKRLEAKGHRVVTLDLPGHGRRAAEVRQASVASYARAVADAMARESVSRGIVVGHSMGGLVIQKVAELVPARIAHLVFLAAVVVPDGSSLAEIHLTPTVREAMQAMAIGRGDGRFLFPADMAWARWMGDVPRDHPAVVRAMAALTPQALRPFVEKVKLDVFYSSRLPRTYIRCLRDAAVPPPKAAEYAARLGVAPIDLDAAHDPMLSEPDALARILERI
jgi:pimeloyl-ACP methyl ester carboxylesterase